MEDESGVVRAASISFLKKWFFVKDSEKEATEFGSKMNLPLNHVQPSERVSPHTK